MKYKTDKEKKAAVRKQQEAWRAKTSPMFLPNELDEQLKTAMLEYEKDLPFKLRKFQFVAVLLEHWLKSNSK